MYLKKKTTGTSASIPVGIGLGLVASMVITLACSGITAYLISAEKIGEHTIGYMVMLILALSAVIGTWIAVTAIKRLRLQISLLFAGCFYLVLLAMTALLFGGQYQGMGISAVIVLAGSMAIAFLPSKGLKIGKMKKV